MFKLYGHLGYLWDQEPFVAKLISSVEEQDLTQSSILFQRIEQDEGPLLFIPCQDGSTIQVKLGQPFAYLQAGDIVRIHPPAGTFQVMYRKLSNHNSIFTTENCNNYCIMCSQPPRQRKDSYLLHSYLQAIPMMSPETKELGISGGEPTLLGQSLIHLLTSCKQHLPQTSIHVLSNGRFFLYDSFCQAVRQVEHPDLMFGVPLYSDVDTQHDFVVQHKGAFDETIRGMLNMARYQIPLEIRVVLHAHTIPRLPQLAQFIGRNLPFTHHVALMGLEMMGFVKMNLEALWIDPKDYQTELATAVHHLAHAGMHVSIYNHPLCLLDPSLWPYARKSISDWKNEYLERCEPCAVREQCGGLFSSAKKIRHSAHLRPIDSPGNQAGSS